MDWRKEIAGFGQCVGTLALLAAVSLLAPGTAMAQGDDIGVWTSVGAEKDFGKKWSVGLEGEFRTRNDSKTADRWSFGVDGSYKIVKGLKVSAAYTFLYDNNREDISFHDDGTYNNWRPSYWGVRHRVSVSLAGSVDVGRFKLSLRERWQYTYRPEKVTERYDFDNAWWEDDAVRGKGSNVLRSRFRVEYDVAKCKVDPYADVELFNAWALQKVRYTVGAEWKIRKKHVVGLSYRFQSANEKDDDNDPDRHVFGISYKFKF